MTQLLRLAAIAAGGVLATGAAGQTDIDPALKARGEARLEAFVTEVSGLSARFEQVVIDADGMVDDGYAGTLQVLRPGRFRWAYTEPFAQELVADGRNLWNYDVELDQVTVTPQAEAIGRSPAAILSGARDALDSLELQGAFEQDGILWVQLAVIAPDSDFAALRFGFRTSDGMLAALMLRDNLDQVTDIRFSDVDTETPVPAEAFEFEVPDNVDLVGEPLSPGDESGAGSDEESDGVADDTAAIAGYG